MKPLNTILALVTLTFPSYAASPRVCRIAAASRVNRVHVVSAAFNAHHHEAQSQFVITAFAVPVAVPVAPFAPYWYGVSDYQYAPSLGGSASQRPPRRTWEALPPESAREAEPRGDSFPDGASERESSIITQRCTSCHGRTSPKQGLSLVDPLDLSDYDRLRALRAVINGEMPPDTEPPLTDADRDALLLELLDETATERHQNDR